MSLRDAGLRFCLSPDRKDARWLHPTELQITHRDWRDVTDLPTDELVALIQRDEQQQELPI